MLIKVTSLLVEVKNVFFLAIDSLKNGWKLFDIEIKDFFVFEDVTLVEHIFSFQNLEPALAMLPNEAPSRVLFGTGEEEEHPPFLSHGG